ncbi:MAG: hypothetical protein LBB75_07785 [Oscillospiraceae bacterium]|jgi:hypothetical protein|nr:hypothetical protein [Oscillospiraceae bacterium]
MKKGIAVLGMFIILFAAAACGPRPDPQPATQPQPTTARPGDDETPLNFGEMLVGLWIASPVVGSGVGECYRFYADGTYTFTPSEFVFDLERYRPPASRGTYEAEGDYVALLMTQSTAMEGGAWVEDEEAGFVLEGGKEKTTAYPEPKEIDAQYLGVFYDLPKEMFSFDGRVYWKTSENPDEYFDSDWD